MRATGLGQRSPYTAFGGERELFFRALSEDRQEAKRAVSEALGHDDASPPERVRGHMLLMAIEFSGGDRPRTLVEPAGGHPGACPVDLVEPRRGPGVVRVCGAGVRIPVSYAGVRAVRPGSARATPQAGGGPPDAP